MKKLILIIYTLLLTLTTYGQDITGQWHGVLKVQGIQLRVVFNINSIDNNFVSTMDSPDQNAKGIPVTTTSFESPTLKLTISNLGAEYIGVLDDNDIIVGTFKQAGQSFPMDLSKEKIKKKKLIRPQEPKKPYPYYTEEVSFTNSIDSITLSGTLSLPSATGKFPVVVMISGSGPQNRDEELLGHKPFLVIADHLTKKGIGVLRFDDRGTAKSKGDFKSATSTDFANDVLSAVTYLKKRNDIDYKNIGLVGHSEGGLIAPMVASESKDIDFIVLLAGPGISGYDILLLQNELISKANGTDESKLQTELALLKGGLDIIIKGNNLNEIKSVLRDYLQKELNKNAELLPEGIKMKQFIEGTVNQLATSWFQFFLKYDPASSLVKVKCPVLALNGEKDLQVPSKVNLDAIEKYLKEGENNNFVVKELPNLNHLFQECSTGSPNEYGKIEQTFAPKALLEISNWILKQVN
ncbi:alpha/beta hydrolase [Algibacter sp.]|nr:alpha/beta hydrolase [Algibacter sp.]